MSTNFVNFCRENVIVLVGILLGAFFAYGALSAEAQEVLLETTADTAVEEVAETSEGTPEVVVSTDGGDTFASDTTEETIVEEQVTEGSVVEETVEDNFTFATEEVSEEPVSEEQAVEESAVIDTVTEEVEEVATPELSTDKDDYHPGETATIFGRFFDPLKTFIIKVFGSDDNEENYTETVEEVTSDEDGLFSFAYLLDNLYRPFYEVVVSTFEGEEVVETWFRDAAVGIYDQCANDDGDGYSGNPGECDWTNGNLNSNNSAYFEGEATVQRLWLEGFVPGSTHEVTVVYGTTKQGKHAYDFLTTWDHSENWISESDLCAGIDNCVGVSESSLDIPEDPNVPNTFEPIAPGDREFVMRGGTLVSATTPTLVSGAYAGGDSETAITIKFTVGPDDGQMCSVKKVQGQDVASCAVALFFGAHIAEGSNWEPVDGFLGATDIPGSPYHVALDAIDGDSVGQRDNQMSAGAISLSTFGDIVINKVTIGGEGSFDYTGDLGGFTLDTVSNFASTTFVELEAGIYSVTESAEAGWDFTDLACTDPDGGTVIDGATATIDLDPEETIVCTYTNTKQGSVTIEKQVVGQDKSFDFTGGINTSLSDGQSSSISVVPGQYIVTEGVDSDYDLTGVVCSGDDDSVGSTIERTATFNIAAGEDVTCVFTNSEIPTLELQKTVINDNGGTATEADFQAQIDAENKAWDIAYTLVPGTYTASEVQNVDGYTAGDWGGACAVDGDVTLDYGDHAVCTISNNDDAPQLTVIKHVINDDGGQLLADDFTMNVTATNPSDDSFAGVEDPGVTITLDAGAYSVDEDAVSGYEKTLGTDCSGTIALGEHKTCTIVNDDVAPTLKLVKTVTNNNGGDEAADSWTLYANADDADFIGRDFSNLGGSGIFESVFANAAYDLTESGVAGYTAGAWSCDGGSLEGSSLTLDLDEDVTCTINNDDIAPQITLIKALDINYGGDASVDDFGLTIGATSVNSGDTLDVDANVAYALNEIGLAGYEFVSLTGDAECPAVLDGTVTLDEGDHVTCTITNQDLPGSISGHKFEDVDGDGVWDLGEPALADWAIKLNGGADSTVTDGDGYYEFTGLAKGVYTITEVQQNGWIQTTANPAAINLNNGEGVTDIDFGNYELGSISGKKFEDVDGDGAAHEADEPYLADWTMRLYETSTNPWTLVDTAVTGASGEYSFANLGLGSYKVCEVLQTGWIETFPSIADNNGSPSSSEEGAKCQTVNIDTSGETNTKNFGNYAIKSLVVNKTALTDYTRTFEWDINKAVDRDTLDMFEGDEEDVEYTIEVTKTGYTDSVWQVAGVITVTNPNPVSTGLDAEIDEVIDSMTGGIVAGVSCPTDIVPAGGSIDCTYSSDLPDATDRTNTAVVETVGLVPGNSGEAAVSFDEPSTLVYDTVNVDDTNGSSWQFGDSGVVSYERTFTCDADEGSHHNVATIIETKQSDDADVTVNCYDLDIAKTAETSYTRTYGWDITKSANPTLIDMFTGDSTTVDYDVVVTKDEGTDSDFSVVGEITITNNTPITATLADVSDELSGYGVVAVDCPVVFPYELLAGESVVCTYESDLSDTTTLTNSGAVTLDNGKTYSATAAVVFGEPANVVDDEVTIDDTVEGELGTTDTSTSYEYSREYSCYLDEGQGTGAGTYPNIASIVETGDEDDESVEVRCYDLSVAKTAEPSFTRTWSWTIDKTSDTETLNLAPNQVYPVNYEVTVDATSEDSNHAVAGVITINNPAPMDSLVTVGDMMTGGIVGTVVCPSNIVPAGGSLVCTYSADLADDSALTNTATVVLANGTEYAGTAAVDFAAATMTEIDEEIDLDDSIYGPLGVVDANVDTLPAVFKYTEEVIVPEELACGGSFQVDNTATLTTNDTGTTLDDTWTVDVALACVCSLTQGFWKTHNDSFHGGAPAYDGWLHVGALKENAGFFTNDVNSYPLSGPNAYNLGLTTWYAVFWTAPQGNAYYNLAHQYMAAKLNYLNGAYAPEIEEALVKAEGIFALYTAEQMLPPKGKAKKAWQDTMQPVVDEAKELAGIFAAFNEGETNPAGHCSEPPVVNVN